MNYKSEEVLNQLHWGNGTWTIHVIYNSHYSNSTLFSGFNVDLKHLLMNPVRLPNMFLVHMIAKAFAQDLIIEQVAKVVFNSLKSWEYVTKINQGKIPEKWKKKSIKPLMSLWLTELSKNKSKQKTCYQLR